MDLPGESLAGLATHNGGIALPPLSSPRPYLHPIRSLAGTVLTDASPADHAHHLGLSIAVSDLNGTNFWGGSTFTAANGPQILPNHGTQRADGWTATSPPGWTSATGNPDTPHAAGFEGALTWLSEHGNELAVERRRINQYPHPSPGTWCLSVDSALTPAGSVPRLEVSSSAVKGRNGAGYGGIFWRFSASSTPPTVLSDHGAGTEAAHGSLSPWLAISLTVAGAPVSVVLAQSALIRPWFIRTEGYIGAGPAVAWSAKAAADADTPLVQDLHAVIHDGTLHTASQALELLRHHPGLHPERQPDRTS
jgi:hypothetical protein